jgi:hypothetical protein
MRGAPPAGLTRSERAESSVSGSSTGEEGLAAATSCEARAGAVCELGGCG